MKLETKKRIELFDIIKCIAIFTVIWGHTATNDELTANPPLLYLILYSVHMPLFFFVAGLSVSLKPLTKLQDWKKFLQKSILTLVVPYFLWALIYSSFSYQNAAYILYGSWQALCQAATLSSLWYLTSFFVARIYVQLIMVLFDKASIVEKRMLYIIPALVFLFIGVLLPKLSFGYPWCMDNAFVAAAFILLGMAFRNKIIVLSVQKGIVLVTTLLCCVVAYILIVIWMGDRFVINLMCCSQYGEPLPALLLALLGGMAYIVIAMLLKRMADEWITGLNMNWLVYIGQHTLGIFILHKPLMQQVIIPLLQYLFGNLCPESILRLIAACLALFAALWLCRLVEHIVPELVGVYRKK